MKVISYIRWASLFIMFVVVLSFIATIIMSNEKHNSVKSGSYREYIGEPIDPNAAQNDPNLQRLLAASSGKKSSPASVQQTMSKLREKKPPRRRPTATTSSNTTSSNTAPPNVVTPNKAPTSAVLPRRR